MVRTKEELIELVKSVIGENPDDDAIALLEDISDTFDTLRDSEKWKTKYEENDKAWRERYTARFSGEPVKGEAPELAEPESDDDENANEILSFEELFKEVD